EPQRDEAGEDERAPDRSDGVRQRTGEVLRAVARLDPEAQPEEVVRRDEHGRAQALDLERPRHLAGDGVPDAAWRERDERREDRYDDAEPDPESDAGLAGAAAPPHVRDEERREDGGVDLRRHGEPEQREREPVASRAERRERGRGERRRPEVIARQPDG